ncbi:Dolichyl-phosphate-mannose-protein mannosyltransferase [uncultured archaeon]|nr:Dolichyl-phosphate-mannose-protein mannosyltransferase [uncultured archaeon]
MADKKIIYSILLILILTLHLIFVIISMRQPLLGDDLLFAEGAKSVANIGKPLIDYGINNPGFYTLWHIPLYIYIMGGFVYLFGFNIYSLRATAAIFNFLTIILVYLITKEILKNNKNKEEWSLFAAAIYALNPIIIQNSMLLDIDGGVLNFAMYLFLYLYIKQKNFLYLIPSLIFVFLSKEIGPVVLFGGIFLIELATLEFKKILKLFLLFFISAGLALGIWWIFSQFLGLNFMTPLLHNFAFGKRDLSLIRILTSVWEFKNFVYFAIPFLIILFFIFTIKFYLELIKERKKINEEEKKNALLFNIIAILIVIMYFYFGRSAWGFPKYQVIAVPAISIFITYMLSKSSIMQRFYELLKSKKLFFIVLLIILAVYFMIIVKDPLIPEFDSTATNVNMMLALKLVITNFVLYIIVPILICLIFFSLFKSKGKFAIILILLTLFAFVYIDILHTVVNYSTYSKYGTSGTWEVVHYLNEKDISAKEVATHSHLGMLLNMSEYYEITFVYYSQEDFKKGIVDNPDINYIIIYERDIDRIGKNMKYFGLQKQIGSYYIFKKNPQF